MKTDSVFYRIFQSNPDILFELLGQSPDLAQGREFGSVEKTQPFSKTDPKFAAIMELIETIVVYKFPSLGREEIENMLGLSELKQTKVYQEALQEGEQIGEQREEQRGEQTGALREARSLILRLLTRRFGLIVPTTKTRIRSLSLTQLEALGEALLEFSQPSDLSDWLQVHT